MFDPKSLEKYLGNGFVCEKHPDEEIFIYGYRTDFPIVWDDVNIHLRGLIIDKHGNPLARSFQKFFHFKDYLSPKKLLLGENQIADLPDGNFQIFEKMDGCLVMMYWLDNKPYLATQRSFSSRKAVKATKILYDKYSGLFDQLKRDRTYIFEAIFPETNVVIDYGDLEDLYLIGVLDNATGMDYPLEDIGFKTPYSYTEDFSWVKDLRMLQSLNIPNKEGFVVVYDNGYRLKIKFPWYNEAHGILNRIKRLQEQASIEISKFKAVRKIPLKKLTNEDIYAALNKTGNIDEVLECLQPSHYFKGVEHWIAHVLEEYIAESQNVQFRDVGDQAEIIPGQIKLFSENISNHFKDTIMWNFLNRIKNVYD